MTNEQKHYFVDFFRFVKNTPYVGGLTKLEPCVPAICECCFWKPVWTTDPILARQFRIRDTIDDVSVLVY